MRLREIGTVRIRRAVLGVALVVGAAAPGAQRAQMPPVPVPFPGQPSQPPAAPPVVSAQTTTSAPATPEAQTGDRPTESTLGVAIYPNADYLQWFDVGRGQRLYLFGTNDQFANVVIYYKNVLRTGGHQVFQAPATQQFDLNVKFQEQTMALMPSVTVKDYTWTGVNGQLPAGYAFVKGTAIKTYDTIIQIVPIAVVK